MKAFATLSATWPSAAPSSSAAVPLLEQQPPASSARCAARSSSVNRVPSGPAMPGTPGADKTAKGKANSGLTLSLPQYPPRTTGGFWGNRSWLSCLIALLAGKPVLPQVDRDTLDDQSARAEALQPSTSPGRAAVRRASTSPLDLSSNHDDLPRGRRPFRPGAVHRADQPCLFAVGRRQMRRCVQAAPPIWPVAPTQSRN